MKVVAKGRYNYVLQASNQEVARLIGYAYESGAGKNMPNEGEAIEVDKMYMQLYDISQSKKALCKAADTLEKYAVSLRLLPPVSIDIPNKN